MRGIDVTGAPSDARHGRSSRFVGADTPGGAADGARSEAGGVPGLEDFDRYVA